MSVCGGIGVIYIMLCIQRYRNAYVYVYIYLLIYALLMGGGGSTLQYLWCGIAVGQSIGQGAHMIGPSVLGRPLFLRL